MMLPACGCSPSCGAKVKTSNSAKNPGREYYACGQSKTVCDFFEWKDVEGGQGGWATSASPHKRTRY
jgi:hypothetical protein